MQPYRRPRPQHLRNCRKYVTTITKNSATHSRRCATHRKASSPDFAALEKAAEIVNKASIDQQQWFPKGTGPEAGKTRALPEIWSKPDDFTAAQKMFSDRAPKLLAAAKTKDAAAVTAAFKEVGGACKNCHDTFRKPED